MKKLLLVLLCLGLCGCATASKMNRITQGMARPEVIRILGKPVSTSAKNNSEYLNYQLYERGVLYDFGTMYFVEIIDDKVESFGRTSDFFPAKSSENMFGSGIILKTTDTSSK